MAEFVSKFIEYAKANRHKASTIYAKECLLRVHIVPVLGAKRLDQITDVDVQALKVRLAEHAPKTVNNVLSVLSKMLRVAKRLKVITTMPVENFDLLKVPEVAVLPFCTFEEYAALVPAAERLDPRVVVAVLLGGDAGLRAGEVMALEQTDVSRIPGTVTVERQVWRGNVDSPKSGKGRVIPMTAALRAALAQVRHLQGQLVLLQDDGTRITAKVLRAWMESAQRLARLKPTGNFHLLRHVLLAPCDAERARQDDPRAGRPPPHHDDDAVHAPRQGPEAAGDQVARQPAGGERAGRPWRRRGGGTAGKEKAPGCPGARWSGKRE